MFQANMKIKSTEWLSSYGIVEQASPNVLLSFGDGWEVLDPFSLNKNIK